MGEGARRWPHRVKFRPGASSRPAVVDWELAESAEYQELLTIEEDIRSIGPAPYTATLDGGEPVALADAEALDASSTSAVARARTSPATRAWAK